MICRYNLHHGVFSKIISASTKGASYSSSSIARGNYTELVLVFFQLMAFHLLQAKCFVQELEPELRYTFDIFATIQRQFDINKDFSSSRIRPFPIVAFGFGGLILGVIIGERIDLCFLSILFQRHAKIFQLALIDFFFQRFN